MSLGALLSVSLWESAVSFAFEVHPFWQLYWSAQFTLEAAWVVRITLFQSDDHLFNLKPFGGLSLELLYSHCLEHI